jgi:lipopolysaccharide export system protein LptC
MAGFDNFHSQFVAWMKIILPVGALVLLSTLFLISRKYVPGTAIPIAQIDLQQRAQDLGATNPSFAGVTENGTEITLQARHARPDPEDMEHLLADEVSMQMRLASGVIIDITADNADMHQTDLTANLDGNVHVITSNGYQISTATLLSRLDRLYAETPGAVTGTSPGGEFWAGRMFLDTDKTTGHIHFLFTDGVRLLYTPQVTKE